jgi:hypothetical protein
MIENEINRLYDRVQESIGPKEDWPEWPGGWGDRADLALLDAVYSTTHGCKASVERRDLVDPIELFVD